MALQLQFESPFGFTLPNAYVRILEYGGNKNSISYRVSVYADEAARSIDRQPVYSTFYECHVPTGDLMSALYADLKSYEMFASAIDC